MAVDEDLFPLYILLLLWYTDILLLRFCQTVEQMEHNVLDGHHYYGISDVAVHRACLVASWTANPGIYQCLE